MARRRKKRRRKSSRLSRWWKRQDRKAEKLIKKSQGDNLYNCIHIPFVLIGKVGITWNMIERMNTIDKSIPGFLFPVWCPRIRDAKKHEKKLHDFFDLFRLTFTGSGKTEYFPIFVLPFTILYTFLVWDRQKNLGSFTAIIIIYLLLGAPSPDFSKLFTP